MDLFAPPTKEELDAVKIQPNKREPRLFDPPTPEELQGSAIEQEKKDEPGLISKGFDYGLRALDYPAGLLRTGLAGAANIPYAAATGKSFVGPEDVKKAFQGQAPGFADYAERAGVPEGPEAFGISARDVGGFGADLVTDPIGLLSKGAKAVKGFRGLSEGAEKLGETAFKSGLKKVDERLVETGSKPVSQVLLERGVRGGTTRSLEKEAVKIGKDLSNERAALYKIADESGELVDMKEALKGADKYITEKMLTNPALEDAGLKLLDKIYAFQRAGKVPVSTASEWKTTLYEGLPKSAFDNFGRLKGSAAKVNKLMAKGFRDEIIKTANKIEPGLGNKIDLINEDWGSIIQAAKPLANQVRKGNTTNAVTSVDAMLLGILGATTDFATTAGTYAVKKTADLGKTTYARSKAGKGLINLGKTGLLDDVSRRSLIEKNKDE